jgi:hypothetical protein
VANFIRNESVEYLKGFRLEIVRRNRIRRVVSELNKRRRIQARKIDILCNDIIASQRNFLNKLKIMSLQIEFYEALILTSDLESVLDCAADTIEALTGGANIAVWIGGSFSCHIFDEQELTSEQADLIESCFTREIANEIYKSCRCMKLEELFEIGLPESDIFSKLSVTAIPLQDIYQKGFILIYHTATRPITPQEIGHVATLVPGLSRAIKACQKSVHPAEKS